MNGEYVMNRVAALIQFVVICLVIGFGTFQMFKGNFEFMFASLPLLMGYYVLLARARRKRELLEEEDD